MTLDLALTGIETNKDGKANITKFVMKDKVYPFFVDIYYKTYPDNDVIETWTEIKHKEKKNVILNQFSSGYLPIRRGDVWLSSLYGSWSNEAIVAQEQLKPGMKFIKNKDGIRISHTSHFEIMFSLVRKPH